MGAPFVTLASAVDIACSLPGRGVGRAVLHQLWEFITTQTVAALLALPLAACSLVLPRDRPRATLVLWLAFVLLFGAAYFTLLDLYLERAALRLMNGTPGLFLARVFGLGCGLGLALVHLLGHLLAPSRSGRIFGSVLVLAALAGNHLVLRDDFAAIHAAVTWPTLVLAGWLACGTEWAKPELARWDARFLTAIAAAGTAAALLIPPPLAIRLELFRQPGAAASWVLANWVWSRPLPEVTRASDDLRRPLPEERAETMVEARRGLPRHPVVVLITVDALRADVLERADFAQRMPRLSGLVQRGVWFKRATAPGSQTAISLATLFSGKYFSQLEWRAWGAGATRYMLPHPDPSVRFPELLSAAGVHTTEVAALSYLHAGTKLIGRFDTEVMLARGRQHVPSNWAAPALVEQISKHRSGRGFFYTHLMDLHEPYTHGARQDDAPFARYLSEAEHLDRSLGLVLDAIERRFRGRAYVILSADHGEAFGEHGTSYHSKTLYEELVRVPLVFAGPRLEARRVDTHVGLIDVGPTVLHLFGLERPSSFEGRSLLPLARGLTTEVPRRLYLEGRLRRGMYLPNGQKIIEDSVQKTVEIYDLTRDPAEGRNLFRSSDPDSRHALGALREFFAARELRLPGYRAPYVR